MFEHVFRPGRGLDKKSSSRSPSTSQADPHPDASRKGNAGNHRSNATGEQNPQFDWRESFDKPIVAFFWATFSGTEPNGRDVYSASRFPSVLSCLAVLGYSSLYLLGSYERKNYEDPQIDFIQGSVARIGGANMKRGAKRPHYDADQMKEVLRLTDGLREANQAGVRELQRWRRSWISEERRKKTCELIKLVAFQINSLVMTLEELRDEAEEQKPSLILITLSLLCDKCSPSEGSAQNKDADIDTQATDVELLHQSLWPTLQELSDSVHDGQSSCFTLSTRDKPVHEVSMLL